MSTGNGLCRPLNEGRIDTFPFLSSVPSSCSFPFLVDGRAALFIQEEVESENGEGFLLIMPPHVGL